MLQVQSLFKNRFANGGIASFQFYQRYLPFEFFYLKQKRLKITHDFTSKILKLPKRNPSFYMMHHFLSKLFSIPKAERDEFKTITKHFMKHVVYYCPKDCDNVPTAVLLQRSTRFPVDSERAPKSRFLHLFVPA